MADVIADADVRPQRAKKQTSYSEKDLLYNSRFGVAEVVVKKKKSGGKKGGKARKGELEVLKIVDKRSENGTEEYKVRWKGFSAAG